MYILCKNLPAKVLLINQKPGGGGWCLPLLPQSTVDRAHPSKDMLSAQGFTISPKLFRVTKSTAGLTLSVLSQQKNIYMKTGQNLISCLIDMFICVYTL